MSKNKRIAPNVIRGGVAIPLGSNYFLMKGKTHREGGIDVGKDLEVEDGELMKVTKNNIKVLSDQPIFNGISPAEYAINGNVRNRFEKAFRAQERFKKVNGLNDDGTKDGDTNKAIFGKIKQKISNIYWHKLRAPKDYSDEKATLKDGSVTEECAKWSNAELQKQGLSIFGDAWTRSSNKGIKKIYSGYDKSKRPTNYDKDEVLKYTLDAADSISRVIDTDKLKHNDIVGLYFRNSPNTKKAYEKGTNGETQTHTGHIVEENGKKYVVHNVHGEVIKNDINDVIGSNHPYGITSVYRAKKLGGNYNQYPSTGKKTKAEMGTMKVDEHGNLVGDIQPSVVTGEKRNIIREMIINELLKDSLKLKKDKTIKTNKIKAKFGTESEPSESIVEIAKRIVEDSQASSNRLAAKITKFDPPLGDNRMIGNKIEKIDSSKIETQIKRNYPKAKQLAEVQNPAKFEIEYGKQWKKDEDGTLSRNLMVERMEENKASATKFAKRVKKEEYRSERKEARLERRAERKQARLERKAERQENRNENDEGKISFFEANPTFVPNLIGAGINVAGSLISHRINKKFLDSIEEPKAPYLLQPTKLKTRINIKPQVDELRRTVRRYNKYFDKNTASSQTAVGRRLNNEQVFIDAFNQIKGNQENQETSLINQDRAQQHETAKFNLTNYNQWLRDKTNFKNSLLEKKAENNTTLVQNIASSATNFIDKENQWKRDMMTLAAIAAGNPNVSGDQMAEAGLPYAKYMEQRRQKREERRERRRNKRFSREEE